MSTVLCFGTFDGLHPGHEDYFRQARAYGDKLVVIVARDETVHIVKGHLPDLSQYERVRAVEAHPLVSEAYIGLPGDKYKIVQEVKPDVIVLGYDQQAFTEDLEETLQSRGLTCKVVRAQPYQPDIYKTSKLRQSKPE